MKRMTVVYFDKGRTMPCKHCFKVVNYGISVDGYNILMVLCENCMKAYSEGFKEFFIKGASKKGELYNREESDVDKLESTETE